MESTGKSRADLVCGVAVILFALSVLAQVPGTSDGLMLFPGIVAAVSLLCGVLIIVFSYIYPTPRKRGDAGVARMLLLTTLFLFAVMALAEYLGFYACLFVVCLAVNGMIRHFCREDPWRQWWKIALLSLVMTAAIYVVFSVLLQIITPSGILL